MLPVACFYVGTQAKHWIYQTMAKDNITMEVVSRSCKLNSTAEIFEAWVKNSGDYDKGQLRKATEEEF